MRTKREQSHDKSYSPLVVDLGGTTRVTSTSERTLIKALEAAERAGARTRLFGGAFLAKLSIYDPATANDSPELVEMLDAVRGADGVLISTPGYHGSVSSLVKNAFAGLEGLRTDQRPYLEHRAVALHRHRRWLASLRHRAFGPAHHRPRPARLADPPGCHLQPLCRRPL